MMSISHCNYLNFKIPNNWVVKKNDETTSVYDNNVEGAITMSFYTAIEILKSFDEHIFIMA